MKNFLQPRNPARWAMIWAGLLTFFTMAYFQNHRPYPNVNSQFSMTLAIVERGTLSIDAYHNDPRYGTIDKALFKGHYYCDKSPVVAFLGVPVFAVYRWLNLRPGQPLDYHAARYWTTLLTVGVAAALLAMMTAAALMRRGIAPARAALGGVLWIAATPLFGYAILIYPYLPSGAMIMGSYLFVSPLLDDPAAVGRRWRIFAGGVLMGLACWTLNTCALTALGLTGLLLLRVWKLPGREWWRNALALWPWALGGLVGISGYFAYTYALFGAFDSPYKYEALPLFREQMAKGVFGATWPNWRVAWLMTFHHFHGIFRYFPLTALALAGSLWCIVRRRAGSRLENALACLVFFGMLTYASGYYMWWGGAAYAPRHLLSALPLLVLGLVPWLASQKKNVVNFLFFIGFVSAFFNSMAVAVDPQTYTMMTRDQEMMNVTSLDVDWPSPYLFNQIEFLRGVIIDFNWGVSLGLGKRVSLIPLWLVWGAAVAGLCAVQRRIPGALQTNQQASPSGGNVTSKRKQPRKHAYGGKH